VVTLELKSMILRSGLKFDYKQYLPEIIRSVSPLDQQGAPKRGFSDDDMAYTEALAEKIEAANGSVELTSEEAVYIAGKVERVEWPSSDRVFRQFVADVRALRQL
jgi:hypothetical protein